MIQIFDTFLKIIYNVKNTDLYSIRPIGYCKENLIFSLYTTLHTDHFHINHLGFLMLNARSAYSAHIFSFYCEYVVIFCILGSDHFVYFPFFLNLNT